MSMPISPCFEAARLAVRGFPVSPSSVTADGAQLLSGIKARGDAERMRTERMESRKRWKGGKR
jgi:hypothetical protein